MSHFRPLALAILAAALAPSAFAQDGASDSGKRFSVVGGYALSEPTRNPEIAGTRTSVDGDGAATLGLSYHVTDNVAIEAWGAAV